MKKIWNYIVEWFKILTPVVLSFSLMVTFLTRFIELANKLYPETSNITVGMSSLPKSLHFLISLDNLFSSKPAIIIILLLTTLVFIYELVAAIDKLVKLRKKTNLQNQESE